MDTALAVKNMRRQSWHLMIQEQSRSGLSVRDYCCQNNISTKTFYYRRKQVQSMYLESAQPATFVELVSPSRETAVYPGGMTTPSSNVFIPQLTVSFGDTVIGINQDTPRQLIAEVLEIIRNA